MNYAYGPKSMFTILIPKIEWFNPLPIFCYEWNRIITSTSCILTIEGSPCSNHIFPMSRPGAASKSGGVLALGSAGHRRRRAPIDLRRISHGKTVNGKELMDKKFQKFAVFFFEWKTINYRGKHDLGRFTTSIPQTT